MTAFQRKGGAIAVFLLFLAVFLAPAPALSFEKATWSDTSPSLNLTHIFEGEINRKGKATGLHHMPGGKAPEGTRLKKILSPPNKAGIYTALVEVLDRNSGRWKEKFSSLFPDRASRQDLIKAILNAYRNREKKSGRKWRGPSSQGYHIEGYLLKDGRIITAYPLYRESE